MNKKTTIIIQLIGELVIPLMGYFLWNWSLLFILLFYLVENLFFSYFRIETLREIKKIILKKDQPRDSKTQLKSLILWAIEFALVHLFILLIYPNQSITKEWIDFFMYQDLGIPQGVILIPLLYLASKMKMKQDVFLTIKNMKSVDELNQIMINFNYTWISIAVWGGLIGLNYFLQINELLNLSFILVLIVLRNFLRN